MLYSISIVLIVLGYLNPIESAPKRFIVEVREINCSIANTSRIKQFECGFKKLSISSYALNMNFHLNQELSKDAEINVLIRIKNAARIVTFLDVKLNICKILKQAIDLALPWQILNEILRTSNLPRACPVKGNFPYNVTGFQLNDGFFPAYAPFLNFNFSAKIYERKQLIASYVLQGATVARKLQSN